MQDKDKAKKGGMVRAVGVIGLVGLVGVVGPDLLWSSYKFCRPQREGGPMGIPYNWDYQD